MSKEYDIAIKGYVTAVVTKYRDGETIVETIADHKPNLLTDAGKTKIHNLLYTNTTTSGYAHGFGYIASTSSVITPSTSDTTLSGEISGSGLTRADAGTKTFTLASSSTLIEHTFTLSATVTTVLASALFDASTVGTMAHIANFSSGTGQLISGDTLKISWTLTAS